MSALCLTSNYLSSQLVSKQVLSAYGLNYCIRYFDWR